MKRMVLISALLVAAGAFGQTTVATGVASDSAHFVAERANSVNWNQDGKYLGYSYREDNGHVPEIGIYDMDRYRGRTLLKLEPNQQVEHLLWLAGDPVELVCTSEIMKAFDKSLVRRAMWVLDGKNLTAKQLWAEDFPAEQHSQLSIEASPGLSHAIITVKTNAGTTYYVITLGAGGVVISTDISQAVSEGHGFAGWTVDGTAFFGGGSKNDLSDSNVLALVSDALSNAGGISGTGSGTFTFTGSVAMQLSAVTEDGGSIMFKLVPSKPNIPVGDGGLELVPTNGVLRPVRFRGYWVDEEEPKAPTALSPQNQSLNFHASAAGTKALWLTPNVKDPQKGALVSPQAELAWLHPDGKTVAFTVNGVLFVRTVKGP